MTGPLSGQPLAGLAALADIAERAQGTWKHARAAASIAAAHANRAETDYRMAVANTAVDLGVTLDEVRAAIEAHREVQDPTVALLTDLEQAAKTFDVLGKLRRRESFSQHAATLRLVAVLYREHIYSRDDAYLWLHAARNLINLMEHQDRTHD